MFWLFLLLGLTAAERLAVLDAPLTDAGTGTICGNFTCTYCCLEGYICATALPECGHISTDDHTERIIFIVFGSFFGAWVFVWLSKTLCNYLQQRKKRGE